VEADEEAPPDPQHRRAEVARRAPKIVEGRVTRCHGARGLSLRDDDLVDLLQEAAHVLLRQGLRPGLARRGDAGLRGVQHLPGAAAARSTVAVVVEIDVSHDPESSERPELSES